MSAERPTVAPELIAALIESTPDRVRRRLDRTPDAAVSWNWQASEAAWSVDTGGETVTLPRGHVVSMEQLACTCLLAPRCFHILSCLTHLKVALVEASQAEQQGQVAQASSNAEEDLVKP